MSDEALVGGLSEERCPDCEWVEDWRFGEAKPFVIAGRPCEKHRGQP